MSYLHDDDNGDASSHFDHDDSGEEGDPYLESSQSSSASAFAPNAIQSLSQGPVRPRRIGRTDTQSSDVHAREFLPGLVTQDGSALPGGSSFESSAGVSKDSASLYSRALFSLKLVEADYDLHQPIEYLDSCVTLFHSRPIFRVPVVRLFGITPSGQRACVHVHGCFPYIYVEVDEDHVLRLRALEFERLASAFERRRELSSRRASASAVSAAAAAAATAAGAAVESEAAGATDAAADTERIVEQADAVAVARYASLVGRALERALNVGGSLDVLRSRNPHLPKALFDRALERVRDAEAQRDEARARERAASRLAGKNRRVAGAKSSSQASAAGGSSQLSILNSTPTGGSLGSSSQSQSQGGFSMRGGGSGGAGSVWRERGSVGQRIASLLVDEAKAMMGPAEGQREYWQGQAPASNSSSAAAAAASGRGGESAGGEVSGVADADAVASDMAAMGVHAPLWRDREYIYDVSVVQARVFFGYHKHPRRFLKISLYVRLFVPLLLQLSLLASSQLPPLSPTLPR